MDANNIAVVVIIDPDGRWTPPWTQQRVDRIRDAIFELVRDDVSFLEIDKKEKQYSESVARPNPIPAILNCPECGQRHVDKGEFATKPHHTHACQHCGMVWRPAIVATVGVQFLPGFKDDPQ